MASQFESIPNKAIFKMCRRLIGQEVNFDDYEELFEAVKEIGTLFNINAQYEDYSYIKNFNKLNYESLVNNDPSNIVKPTLKVYRVPYYIIENLIQRQEFVQDIDSYDDTPIDLENDIEMLEYEDKFNIWDGIENPERDADIIDSTFDSWKIRPTEIKKRNY
jgi:hypothetical protein